MECPSCDAAVSEGQKFCHECGATLFFEMKGEERISIAAGSLDGATGLETIGDIFLADKGDYYVVEDGPHKYPQFGEALPMPEQNL